MPIKTTEAVTLRAYNWSESSRTVVFFTRDFGRLALTDRGGRRLTSKRGRLHQFALLEITFYASEKESAGYLSDVRLIEAFPMEGEGSLGRLAYASAATELLGQLLSDEQPHGGLFQYFVDFLGRIAAAPRQALPALFLTFFLHSLSHLGYHPHLSACVGCGREVGDFAASSKTIAFCTERGGVVCGSCQRAGEYYIPLPCEGHQVLNALQRASLTQAETVPIGYRESLPLLDALTKFTAYQSGIKDELKSLGFLEKLKDNNSRNAGTAEPQRKP